MSFRPETLIGALFDSVADDAAFAALPARIAALTDAPSVCLHVHGKSGDCVEAVYGLSPDMRADYNAYFWTRDVWLAGCQNAALGTVMTTDSFITEADFLNTEIYADLLRRHGDVARCLGMVAALPGGDKVAFAVHRARGQPMFAPELERGMEALAPLITHTMQARRRGVATPARLAQALLDDQGDAVMVVSADRRLSYANAAARRLLELRRPLRLEAGRVVMDDPALAPDLARAVTWACTGRGGGVLNLSSSPPGYRISADALPGADRHLACIRVRDDTRRLSRNVEAARLAHGLSPAEAALAKGLARGLTLAEHAARRDVSLATVKTQLRGVFDKMGVSRQADLVRLLWSGD